MLKRVYVLDESEFSEFVTKHFDRPYSLQQHGHHGECLPNNSCWEVGDFVPEPSEHGLEYLESVIGLPVNEWKDVNGVCSPVTLDEWLDRDASIENTPFSRHEWNTTGVAEKYWHEIWWQRNFYPPLPALLDKLFDEGDIQCSWEDRDVLIRVYW